MHNGNNCFSTYIKKLAVVVQLNGTVAPIASFPRMDYGGAGSKRSANAPTKEPEMPKAQPTHKPGQIVPKSGQYPVVGPKGGDTGKEVTVVKGEPFPPTPKPGMGYGQPDLTKHSS